MLIRVLLLQKKTQRSLLLHLLIKQVMLLNLVKKEKVTKIRKMHLRNYQLLIKKIQIVKRKS
ncbi:MAG: hypothetical protein CMN93_00150 [Synechococcus sp. CPC35]|nr:hypothetical protein [Synechococcus sp. CPC35]